MRPLAKALLELIKEGASSWGEDARHLLPETMTIASPDDLTQFLYASGGPELRLASPILLPKLPNDPTFIPLLTVRWRESPSQGGGFRVYFVPRDYYQAEKRADRRVFAIRYEAANPEHPWRFFHAQACSTRDGKDVALPVELFQETVIPGHDPHLPLACQEGGLALLCGLVVSLYGAPGPLLQKVFDAVGKDQPKTLMKVLSRG